MEGEKLFKEIGQNYGFRLDKMEWREKENKWSICGA